MSPDTALTSVSTEMSNALTTLVPTLDGTNYHKWLKAMQAYLMSMDLWEYANGDETQPTLSATPSEAERTAFKAWKSANQKALANIILRVNSTIRVDLGTLTIANTVWNRLKTYFDVIQPTTVFKDFKEAISIRIDVNQHPLPQINKLQASVHRLTTNGVAIPEIIQAMLLLSALPPKWEMLISILCTNHQISSLQIKHVCEAVMAQWEAENNKHAKHAPFKQPQNAQKLSAIKRKHGDPNFKQQCGAGSGGGGGGGTGHYHTGQGQGNPQGQKKRGKRGGKKAQATEQQAEQSYDYSHLASRAGPLAPFIDTIARQVANGRGTRANQRTKVASTFKGKYPAFNKAHAIVQDIGVPGTSNTLRTLEERIAPLDLEDSDDDRTTKRSKSSPEPSDLEDAGDATPSHAPTPTDQVLFTEAEDCVSLGENDWDVDAMVCDAAGLFDQGSVSPSATLPYTADKRLPTRPGFELNSVQSNVQGHVNENCEGAFNCTHGIELAKCAKCENARTKSQSARWLLDSGASSHFTHNIDDFIEYEATKSPILVKTASKPIHIKGKGAVLITHDITHRGHVKSRTTRLYPVFYIPEITGRLLSVGEFLQQGLRIYGDAKAMILRRQNSAVPLIQCVPAKAGHTIYWLDTIITNVQAHATIYTVDYKLLHKRFGHPSRDVLRHAKEKTKGFPPLVEIPKEPPVCLGCVQGKMPSHSHLQSESRASKPFEKIHSDLKSFPVESYHKYKYFISFLDDHTSYVWVVCLRTKSGAIGALRQYIALVRNHFGTTIRT